MDEQLAAIALLGMHKAPSPPPSDMIATEAAGIRKKRKDSSGSPDAASSSLPTASSKKQRNSTTTKRSSKKKQRARGISRPSLPLKGKNKSQPAKVLATKPMSPVDRSPQKEAPCISPEQQHPGFALPENSKTMTFNEKLHHLLGQDEFHDSIAWVPHGRAFRVLDSKLLEERKVLEKYFGCSNYDEFGKELLHHGLKKAKHGDDQNVYYHEYFLRGMPHLVKQITQSQRGNGLVDAPASVPALPRITDAVVATKEPALKTNVTPNEEALLKYLRSKQQPNPAPSFGQMAAPPKTRIPTFTKEQEAMQYLLGITSAARAQAPAPQPSADSSALFLQNAVANLLGQQGNNNILDSTSSASAQLAFLQQQYSGDFGINILLNQQKKATQTSYQQPPANTGASFWGQQQQQQQQDQTALLAALLGLPVSNNAPATSPMPSAQQGHALNALNLQPQALQQQPPRLEPKAPDLQSAILCLLLQNQG